MMCMNNHLSNSCRARRIMVLVLASLMGLFGMVLLVLSVSGWVGWYENKEDQSIHICMIDIRQPYILYSYYVDGNREVKHGDHFRIMHQSNGYLIVDHSYYEHGQMKGGFSLYSIPPTNTDSSINLYSTTNLYVGGVESAEEEMARRAIVVQRDFPGQNDMKTGGERADGGGN